MSFSPTALTGSSNCCVKRNLVGISSKTPWRSWTQYWLQHIDWQTKFLTLVLDFNKHPSSKSLRPLVKLYGRDWDRMKAEAEATEAWANLEGFC